MTGRSIRLFTDEDVDAALAAAFRQRGYDAVSCLESGRSNQHLSDEPQLVYATEQERAILVFNTRDYFPRDVSWKAVGRRPAGIIASAKIEDLGELPRRVMRHLDTTDPEAQHDTLLRLAS
jgi:hypothetical protein